MARQWRIEFSGAIYHVMSRGNAGQDIFRTDQDRQLFLDLLEELVERFNIEVHAYMLMGNHYHLLIKTNDANVSKAMQWFGTSYTRKFNLKNHTSGHLFQGRFKSILVENDTYLLRLSCYIHRNPLRAGIVARLVDFQWSSYRFYAYKRKAPVWLSTKTILH
jgi:putative transposase